MEVLPKDFENLELIRNQFADELAICVSISGLMHGVVLNELFEAVKSCPTTTCGVALNSFIREIRRYKSIVWLCQLGETENAGILTRSLFEGLLAMRYIFRSDFAIDECSEGLRNRLRQLPPIPSDQSERDFRASLYHCAQYLAFYRVADKGSRHPGTEHVFTPENIQSQSDMVNEIKEEIGEDWYQVQSKHPFTFSGLNIRQLAESGGHAKTYDTIYGLQSQAVHANTMIQLIEFGDKELFLKLAHHKPDEIRTTLLVASALVAELCEDFAEAFNLASKPQIDKMKFLVAAIDPTTALGL